MEITPHPFGELVKTWLKVTRMTEAFFQRNEAQHVAWRNTLLSIVALYAALSQHAMVVNDVYSQRDVLTRQHLRGFPPETRQSVAGPVACLRHADLRPD